MIGSLTLPPTHTALLAVLETIQNNSQLPKCGESLSAWSKERKNVDGTASINSSFRCP